MIKIFDYIFYRAYKQYEKWREDYPYAFAEGVIVVFQIFAIYSILLCLSFFGLFPRSIDNPKNYAIFLIIVVYLFNHYRYKDDYLKIIEYYDKVDTNRSRNGVLVVVLIVVVIIFPVLVGVFRNNFGFDI